MSRSPSPRPTSAAGPLCREVPIPDKWSASLPRSSKSRSQDLILGQGHGDHVRARTPAAAQHLEQGWTAKHQPAQGVGAETDFGQGVRAETDLGQGSQAETGCVQIYAQQYHYHAPQVIHKAAEDLPLAGNLLAPPPGLPAPPILAAPPPPGLAAPPGLVLPGASPTNPAPLFQNGVAATTLLVRNVSRRLTQEDAMQLLPQGMFKYTLFYLLWDLTKNRGSGRIFITFATPYHAKAFYDTFNGKRCSFLSGFDEECQMKRLEIQPSHRQGLVENVTHWRDTLNTTVHASLFPAVFVRGMKIFFWDLVRAMPSRR